MALLDGRYEVIAQRAVGGGRTLFEATAPDGAPLRIEWFDLPAEREAEFESYRRLLRRLKKAGLAAVHDVIARPGAHYVAWERAPADSTAVGGHAGAAGNGVPAELAAELGRAGYPLGACDIRRPQARHAKAVLYGLTFGAAGQQGRDGAAPTGRQQGDGQGGRSTASTAGGALSSTTHPRPRSAWPWSAGPRPPDAEPATADPDEAEKARPLRHHQSPLARGADALARVPQRTLAWGMAGLLSALAVVGLLLAFRLSVVDAVVSVPDVVGTDAKAAVARLAQLGLAVEAGPLVSDEAPGTVVTIEPPAGSSLRPGRTVVLRYALPPGELAPTEVPSLLGLPYPDAARAALEAAGLRLGEAAHVHAQSPAGVVLAQDVDAGSRIGSGAAVAVLVSLGPQPAQTFLPDLVGLDLADARALAQVAGIDQERVLVDEVVASVGAKGKVLAQSLAPYVPVARDSAVLRLVVQTGEPAAPAAGGGTPDLVGMSLAQARSTASGWDVQVAVVGDPGLPEGVIAQDPQPGADAGGGRTLVLTVNAHPVALTTDGVRAVVRTPQLRSVEYAWAIQPGIGEQQAQVWASDLQGNRTLVSTVGVRGGEILRGTYRTVTAGPVRFELLLGGVPYGEPLLVP